jgi:hypothetical protein
VVAKGVSSRAIPIMFRIDCGVSGLHAHGASRLRRRRERLSNVVIRGAPQPSAASVNVAAERTPTPMKTANGRDARRCAHDPDQRAQSSGPPAMSVSIRIIIIPKSQRPTEVSPVAQADGGDASG